MDASTPGNDQLQQALAILEQMASFSGPTAERLRGIADSVGNSAGGGDAQTGEMLKPEFRYRSLVEKLPAVSFMCGLDASAELYISPQIEGMLGFTQEEWLANPLLWYRQLHPDDRQSWVEQFAETCATGSHFRAEYRLLNRAGQIVWIQGECQVIRDDSGRPMFLQGIAVDITHIKRAVEAEEGKRQAEANNAAKSEFLARMSHEIRTPLNGVVGMIDLLCNTEMTDQQKRYAQLARDAAGALLVVINDILDFSKIEAGKVEIEQLPFDLHKFVLDTTELLTPLAAKKKLSLRYAIEPAVPRNVVGDPNRIRQIFNNLVNNALKFTAEGGVTLNIGLQSLVGQTATVRVQVEDTGIGIPANRIDRLFKSFSQVDTSTTRKYGGTGLGLAICKRLAELMGGEIGVNSVEGKGTTFWFTLQLTVATEQSAEKSAEPADAPQQSLAGLHLLVAEDNELNQFVTRETLKRVGCTCDIVSDGAQAVEASARGGYHAILMDCQMPVMDGLEAARRIRQREVATGAQIPIIALTAEALQGDREKCLAAGMSGYVTKPINPTELFKAIGSLAKTMHAASAPAVAPTAPLTPPIDLENVLRRCLNDAAFAQQTLEKFQRRAFDDVERIRQQLPTGNAEELTRLAHNLKSVAAHVSASPLQKIAAELEQAGQRRDITYMEQQLTQLDAAVRNCASYIPTAIERLARLPRPATTPNHGG